MIKAFIRYNITLGFQAKVMFHRKTLICIMVRRPCNGMAVLQSYINCHYYYKALDQQSELCAWVNCLSVCSHRGLMIGVTSVVLLILENTIVEDSVVMELPFSVSIMSAIVALLLVAAVIKVRNPDYEQV